MNVELAPAFAKIARETRELEKRIEKARESVEDRAEELLRAKCALSSSEQETRELEKRIEQARGRVADRTEEILRAKCALSSSEQALESLKEDLSVMEGDYDTLIDETLKGVIQRAYGKFFDVKTGATPEWLVNPLTGRNLIAAMYIPDLKLVIDYDNEYQFEDKEFFGKTSFVDDVVKLEAVKECLCYVNSVKLIRIQEQVITGANTAWMDELEGYIKKHIASPGKSLPSYIAKSPSVYIAHKKAGREMWKSRVW